MIARFKCSNWCPSWSMKWEFLHSTSVSLTLQGDTISIWTCLTRETSPRCWWSWIKKFLLWSKARRSSIEARLETWAASGTRGSMDLGSKWVRLGSYPTLELSSLTMSTWRTNSTRLSRALQRKYRSSLSGLKVLISNWRAISTLRTRQQTWLKLVRFWASASEASLNSLCLAATS